MPKIRLKLSLMVALLLGLQLPLNALAEEGSSPIFSPAYREIQQDYAHQALIRRFYTAFQHHDAATMRACYHPDVEFEDPVFGKLKGREAGAMWTMLLEAGGPDLKIAFSDIDAQGHHGSAHWEAWYHFSATGLPVDNRIQAEFEFKDGLIYRHHDHFDLYRWTTMALGAVGSLLGNTPLLQNQLRKTARERLQHFLVEHPEL